MSPQSNLNKSNAPRDLATLCRAGRFQLRQLATELGVLNDPAAAAAFQGMPTDEQARQVKEALDSYDRANGGSPQPTQQQMPPQMAPQMPPQMQQQQQQFAQPNGSYPQQPGFQPPQMQQQQQFAPQPQMQQNFSAPQGFQPPQQLPPNGLAANGGFSPPMPQQNPATQMGYAPQQPPQGFPQQPPQQQPMFTAPQDQPAPAPSGGKAARKPRTKNNAAPAPAEGSSGHMNPPAESTPKDLQAVLDGQRDILDELENMRKKNEILTALVYIVIENSFEGDLSFFLNRVNEINPSLQDGVTRLLGKGAAKS